MSFDDQPDDPIPHGECAAEIARLGQLVGDLPPLAIAEVVRVLRHGAVKYAAASPAATGSGQTIGDHLRHALEHIGASITAKTPHGCVDSETNALHITHATARLLLAAEMALATEVTRG